MPKKKKKKKNKGAAPWLNPWLEPLRPVGPWAHKWPEEKLPRGCLAAVALREAGACGLPGTEAGQGHRAPPMSEGGRPPSEAGGHRPASRWQATGERGQWGCRHGGAVSPWEAVAVSPPWEPRHPGQQGHTTHLRGRAPGGCTLWRRLWAPGPHYQAGQEKCSW